MTSLRFGIAELDPQGSIRIRPEIGPLCFVIAGFDFTSSLPGLTRQSSVLRIFSGFWLSSE
jgi:hypothetical protein